jgi:flagellar hook-associated protein 3 FlgL
MIRTATALNRERRTAEILLGEQRLEEARDRVSSGRRIQRPSDSPAEIGELLRTRSSAVELTRRRDAADAFLPFMKASSDALQGITDGLREVRTLTLQANNGTTSAEQHQLLADQVERLRTRILSLANSQMGSRSLFAGTKTDIGPFAAGPPVSYLGNGDPLPVSLTAGAPFSASITGEALLNRRSATDLFRSLSTLETAIRAGDTAGMTGGLRELDADLNNVIRLNGDLGARVQYVGLARQQADDSLTAAHARQSQLQDVDLAQAVIDEQTAEHAQEATLAMAARINRPSLLDYLS